MKTYTLTPAAGKRLIAKAVAEHPAIKDALVNGTIVITAGTTNGYVAEEILMKCGVTDFDKRCFFRGVTLPPVKPVTDTGRVTDQSKFPGDVVIVKGTYESGKEIFDVAADLKEGDVILKGANALDVAQERAGVLIGHPKGGTVGVIQQAVIGRRVKLLVPVGLEKRVTTDMDTIADMLNEPGSKGPRFWPIPGEVLTELDAISLLTGAGADLVSSGGICGAEGCVWVAVHGDDEQAAAADELVKEIFKEPAFEM